jgi:hypothetical protein
VSKDDSGWTFGTLKAYFDAILTERKEQVTVALQAADQMAAKHNDLIRKGERDAAVFVTKDELAASLVPLRNDIDRNTSTLDRTGGKASANQRLTTTLIALGGVLVSAGLLIAALLVR